MSLQTPPSIFIMKLRPADRWPSLNYCYDYILISACAGGMFGSNILTIVDNPNLYVRGGRIKADGVEGEPFRFLSQRITRTSTVNPSVILTRMMRTRFYLEVEGGNRYYEYCLENCADILGMKISSVWDGSDLDEKYHFKINSIQNYCDIYAGNIGRTNILPVLPPFNLRDFPQLSGSGSLLPLHRPDQSMSIDGSANDFIPHHVLKIFIENAISKNEQCSISMEDITLENAAYLPCGHLFTIDSIKKAVEISEKCPNCRKKVRNEQIQTMNTVRRPPTV